MKFYILLLRPKDWAKNLFLFLPSFFAGDIFSKYIIIRLVIGFISFCCFASSIYIVNDYNDIENDRKHPVKSKRPLASGKVKKSHAMVVCVLLIILGSFLAHFADHSFLFFFLLTIYFLINIFYSFGLKNIAILDIVLVSAGFVLRVKSGAVIAQVGTSEHIVYIIRVCL
jgi:decaprenyl-phosphate phosphoribosyltransferase